MTDNSNSPTADDNILPDIDFQQESPDSEKFTLDERYTIKGVFVDDTPFLTGRSLIGHDQQGNKFLVAFKEDLGLEIDFGNLVGDNGRLLVISDVEYAREGEPIRFMATEETAIYDPLLGDDMSDLTISDPARKQDVPEPAPPAANDDNSSNDQKDTPEASGTTQQTLGSITGDSVRINTSSSDDPQQDETAQIATKNSSEPSDQAEAEPVLAGATPGETVHNLDPGIGTTTFPTASRLAPVQVTRYQVNPAAGADVSDDDDRWQLTYEAARAIRNQIADNRGHPSFEIAVAEPLELVATAPLSVNELHFESTDDITGISYLEGDEILHPESDSRVLERLLEEQLKRQAVCVGYQAPAVNRILSGKPYEFNVTSDGFRLYDRFVCTVQVATNGQVYLHVNPRTRIRTQYTLDQISLNQIRKWTRVITTYSNRGYRVIKVGPERVTDKVVKGHLSIPDYFRAPDSPSLDDTRINAIERDDRPVVWATKQGSPSTELVPHAPQLLALQGHTENLDRHAPDFFKAARKQMYRSPQKRIEIAVGFSERVGQLGVADQQLPLDTESNLFRGDNAFKVVELYPEDAQLLEFADGAVGAHPSDVGNYGVFEAPSPFRICYLHPKEFEQSSKHKEYWQLIEDELETLGAPPDTVESLGYTAKRSDDSDPETLATRITTRIDPDEFDALFGLLPADDPGRDFFTMIDPYDPFKRAFGRVIPTSQMAHWDNLKNGDIFSIQNTALGLIAAAGGIPYTVRPSMPDPSDVFIGVDVGKAYRDTDEGDEQEGVRIGASATVALGNGALIGHTNTGAQGGERIPPQKFVEMVRDSLVSAEEVTDEKPGHVTIYRDGFLYDDTSDVEAFLKSYGPDYDIVEIRKRAPMRVFEVKPDGIFRPRRSMAAFAPNGKTAYLVTYGRNEPAINDGVPRPITVERVAGNTDIETLARQVYLLSECHVSAANSTIRLPITTAYADKASDAVAKGYLSSRTGFTRGIGFL